jgi:hypothetical protein
MFDPKSRYYSIDTTILVAADGRMIAYKRRRFLPPAGSALVLAEVMPTVDERLDLLTARTLGDPEAFWRVCDANGTLSPFRLLEDRSQSIRIPTPQV